MLDSSAKPSIVAIGDSITKGYPDDYSWVNLASKKIQIPIENLAIKGETFAGILLRLDQDIIPKSPDFCIITAGTNDFSLEYTLDDLKKTIKEIILELEKEGIICIFGLPIPTVDEYVEAKLKLLRQWMIAVCSHVIPFNKEFEKENLISGTLLLDGVHPTQEGHQRMADACAHEVRKILLNFARL